MDEVLYDARVKNDKDEINIKNTKRNSKIDALTIKQKSV